MTIKRLRIKVYGVVQGVGFRPFVHNLAVKHEISGSVCNKGPFVDIVAQGGERALTAFLLALKEEAPARSQIRRIETQELMTAQLDGFEILKSENSSGEVFPSPDIAICKDCARELFDKNDRRYLHPFINCTACGPRLTILGEMPYDRAHTSMASFKMCGHCNDEYTDPSDRRYHAQPVCCNKCGPRLEIIGGSGIPKNADPIAAVREVLRKGGIAAIKGIGGFHLCCDAANDSAVSRLRRLKGRPSKPFAVMVRDLKTASRECFLENGDEKILDSPQKPILLLKKRESGHVSDSAAPQNPNLGLMLPYAPVQLLLFNYPDGLDFTDCLVMTSGNISGEPICISGGEAAKRLCGLCDIILSNNREIRVRADDSVMSEYKGLPYMIRRSRGYAPLPVAFVKKGAKDVLAVGGELKNTFCLTRGDKLYLSPYIGDLSNANCVDALDDTYGKLKKLLRIKPEVVACDLHPGYNSTAYAKSLGLPLMQIQHHFAHIASCMAENGLDGEVIGVSFDGSGYGSDGTVWGGEFLKASYGGFERLSSIAPFPLAGGDAAARECFRPAVGTLFASCGAQKAQEIADGLSFCTKEQFDAQTALIKSGINCVTATSAGRLFDAACAVLGIKYCSTYEGEAACALEAAAERYSPLSDKSCVLPAENTNDIIKLLAEKKLKGESADKLAFMFHAALAHYIAEKCRECRERTGIDRVVLSGGVFTNRLLLSMCEKLLKEISFKIYIHSLVPCGDGGIALGQAAIAVYNEVN